MVVTQKDTQPGGTIVRCGKDEYFLIYGGDFSSTEENKAVRSLPSIKVGDEIDKNMCTELYNIRMRVSNISAPCCDLVYDMKNKCIAESKTCGKVTKAKVIPGRTVFNYNGDDYILVHMPDFSDVHDIFQASAIKIGEELDQYGRANVYVVRLQLLNVRNDGEFFKYDLESDDISMV